jgi:RimJ/RimL family protein N-acetyltransferase
MSEIVVRVLREDDWDDYRAVRLAALSESPEAFKATYEEESRLEEQEWRERMRRSTRLVAARGEAVLGVASLGDSEARPAQGAQIFGLWVVPSARGTGVAWELVQACADHARAQGKSHLSYWVGTENGRAVAFASSFGFRPTDTRRPMRVASSADGEEELAMTLPLGADPGAVPNSRRS